MAHEIMKFAEAGVPAHIQNAGLVNQNEGLIVAGDAMARISIKGKMFTLKVPSKEDRIMPAGKNPVVIIVGFSPAGAQCAKAFYSKGYSPGSEDAPDCSSSDGIKPDTWVSEPVHTACGTCPNNVFGTSRNQQGELGKGKACSDKKRLVVLPSVDADALAVTPLFVLDVPATSLKALSNYARELNRVSASVQAMDTELGFEAVEHPQLSFTPTGWVTAQQVEAVKRRMPDVVELLDRLGSNGPHSDDAPKDEAGAEVEEPVKEVEESVVEKEIEKPQVEGMELVNAEGELQFFEHTRVGLAMMEGWTVPEKEVDQPQGLSGLFDSAKVPWSAEHHAATKTFKADGRWKIKRGTEVSAYDAFAAPYTGSAEVGPATETTQSQTADVEGAGEVTKEASASLDDVMSQWA